MANHDYGRMWCMVLSPNRGPPPEKERNKVAFSFGVLLETNQKTGTQQKTDPSKP